ncbi:MAG: cardiolipin synthase [Clostridia bacterium]|nr:cardiolipin synthase [Clostridia bacterium]
MKRRLKYKVNDKTVERDINYIPVRYIIAMLLTVLEIVGVIASVVICCIYIPYFYIAAFLTTVGCVISIVASGDNPDYKVPWLIFVITVPIVGFMLYLMFYSRKLKRKFVVRLRELRARLYKNDSATVVSELEREDILAASCARLLSRTSGAGLYHAEHVIYYPLGEDAHRAMLADLEGARRFIFLEFFIIEEGKFWGSILEILKRKAKEGVDVRVVYDDIGCMSTLPGNYFKLLGTWGIKATPFSRLRGQADSEFNNRSHRKILVIDGAVGYTGGVNLADEYINETERFGHWKDVAVRITGECVNELTSLFLTDYGINVKSVDDSFEPFFQQSKTSHGEGYILPFGDGPRPIYERRVAKGAIMHMLSTAKRYVYIMTPYLVIDSELCLALEGAALRGVDVRLILPHIPDKKLVFMMARSLYPRLMSAGVRIYEYESGFVHAKVYLADGESAIVGTVNMDYRSLVHHFENAVYMYRTECISDIKRDFDSMLSDKCIVADVSMAKAGPIKRLFLAVLKLLAPML